MESNNDDFSDDECNLIYSSALSVVELFTLKNREYFKLDPDNSKNLRKIKKKENEIDMIIENIKKKYSYLEILKNCKNESHSKIAFDLDHIFEDNKRLINSYNREKISKSNITEKFIDIELSESSQDDTDKNKFRHISRKDVKVLDFEKDSQKVNNNNKESNDKLVLQKNDDMAKLDYNLNKTQIQCENKGATEFLFRNETKTNYQTNEIEKEKEKEQMEYIQANALGEIDIFTLEEILENSKEYKGDEEFRKNLIHLKNQIQELSVSLENGIIQSNEKLDIISDDIKTADLNVDEVNKNLKEAAIERNKVNKFKYPLIFGTIGSTLGIVVPGIGNIIGGSVGSALGYYLSKVEKKQIDKLDNKNKKK